MHVWKQPGKSANAVLLRNFPAMLERPKTSQVVCKTEAVCAGNPYQERPQPKPDTGVKGWNAQPQQQPNPLQTTRPLCAEPPQLLFTHCWLVKSSHCEQTVSEKRAPTQLYPICPPRGKLGGPNQTLLGWFACKFPASQHIGKSLQQGGDTHTKLNQFACAHLIS